MRKTLTALLLFLCLGLSARAAASIRPEEFKTATDSLSRMYSRRTTVQNKLTLKKVVRKGDLLDFHFDHSLGDFPGGKRTLSGSGGS